MAIPVPRSYQQLLSDAIDKFISDLPVELSGIKVGGPLLSIFEAFCSSDARDTQDIFNLLSAIDLNSADGTSADNIGNSENTPRLAALASNGTVTITDTSFSKIATKLFQGAPAPVIGTTTIYVTDASEFPATGSVYVGRGTVNVEGPLPYTAPTLLGGGYWSLTITGGTQRFHNITESVILAQGGDRLVAAGTLVQTRQGNAIDAVTFSTLQPATLLDGEAEVTDVPVVCQEVGIVGNVAAGAISVVPSPAFTGMGVTNPDAISNGREQEDTQSYKERIKAVRASRSKGTQLAILTGVLGVTAPDESSVVQSASVVRRFGRPTTLYIDDGTGYEEKSLGVAIESVVGFASGGEEVFQLSNGRPIAKAYVETSITAPFSLTTGAILACLVGGVRSEHTFDASMFTDIESVTAHDLIAAINSNPNLLFVARVSNSGRKVSLSAKADVNEDIQVVAPSAGTDANTYLGFPSERADTVKLYLNDRLLYKDGLSARLSSNPQTSWVGFDEGDTLIVSIDGTAEATYAFTAQDFIDANTGYTTVSEHNSLDSWAAVINAKIPGVTASVSSEMSLELVSNLGPDDRASIIINPLSTLASKGMWETLSAEGASSDYTLDRNLGQVVLNSVLEEGDSLSAGTLYTRGYIQSSEIGTVVMAGAGGNIYLAVDGGAEIVSTGITAATYLKAEVSASSPVKRLTAFSDNGLTTAIYPFLNLQVGDFLIAWDPAFAAATPSSAAVLEGIWRISNVDVNGQWFELDTNPETPPGAPGYYKLTGFVEGGLTFCRSTAVPQAINLPAGNYAAADLASTINAAIVGATASTYRTKYLRITTNTYGDGDIAFLTADTQGQALGFEQGLSENTSPHIAVIESGNSEIGTPGFNYSNVETVTPGSPTTFTLAEVITDIGGNTNSLLGWVRSLPTPDYINRYGSNTKDHTSIAIITSDEIEPRKLLALPVVDTGVAPNNFYGDRVFAASPFGLGPNDALNVTLDGDSVSKNYAINTYRRCLPDANVPYGSTIKLFDVDNGSVALSDAFGQDFDFGDFAVYMKARYISHKSDNTKSLLWRYNRFGPEGNLARVRYAYPSEPDQEVAITTTRDSTVTVDVQIPSGALRAGVSISASEKFAAGRGAVSGTTSSITFFTGCRISQASRAGTTVTITLAMPTTDVTDHQFQTNDTLYLTSNSANFPSGLKTVTRVNATQVTYTEAGAAVTENFPGATSPLMFTWTSTPQEFTGVVVGDIVNVGYTSLAGVYRVEALGDSNKLWFQVYVPLAANTMLAYALVPSTDVIQFYPLTSNTVSALSTAINALNGIVTTTVIGTGAGSIVRSTLDDYLAAIASVQSYALADGINYVSSSSYDIVDDNLDLVLKLGTAANLTSPNDWANEQVRLVPQIAKNIADFLNTGLVTGLGFGGGDILVGAKGAKVQIASETPGSDGAVQVVGGSANALRALVFGAASVTSPSSIMTAVVETSAVQGLSADQWVSIDNTSKALKSLDWTNSTTLNIEGNGKVTVGVAGTAWRYAGSMSGPVVGGRYNIEHHGRFTAFIPSDDTPRSVPTNFGTIEEGDWVSVPLPNGDWEYGASLNHIGLKPTVTVLDDGRILIAGGTEAGVEIDDVEIYDPTTQIWTDITSTDPIPTTLANHTATKLPDGRVLFVGGSSAGVVQSAVHIFDPEASSGNRWTTVTSMNGARKLHTATLLGSGSVLVAGGDNAGELATCELYNIDSDTWLLLGATLADARYNHTATAITSNLVLIAGGQDAGGALATCELYSASTQTISQPVSSGVARYNHTASLLPNGKVLIVGGFSGVTSLTSVQIFDITLNGGAGGWTTASALPETRSRHAAVTLESNEILIIGGITANDTANPLASCLIYNYLEDTWIYTGSLITGRMNHTAAIVGDGAVAIGGVSATSAGEGIESIEEFDVDGGISAINTGFFRIVKVLSDGDKWGFWIENSDSLEERAAVSYLRFLDRSSFLPGDTLSIGSNIAGIANQGLWTVASIDPLNKQVMHLQGIPTATAGAVALGSTVGINGIDGSLARLIKKILWIAQHDDDATYSDIAFATNDNWALVNATNGSQINALDKLEFQTQLDEGVDGYRYNTGLIAEVNKVIYGDESDPSTYPGIVALGAAVNIQGPVIKKIQVSLALRLRSGITADVINRVKSEVAGVINSTPVGKDIAISDIVTAAASVDGVAAVSILSPNYSASSDIINVQPYEKPLVLDLTTDIVVSLIGA